jgi:hypothetical protein
MLGQDQVPGQQVYDLTPRKSAPIEQTTTWRQVGMLGQDYLLAGQQVYDLTPRAPLPLRDQYSWTQSLNIALFYPPFVPTGPLGVVANQYDWPLPPTPYRIEQTTTWRQVGMLGQDVLPINQYDWPLPKAPPWAAYRTWTWWQVGMLGQDKLPAGAQVTDLPPRAPLRASDISTWIQSVNLSLATIRPFAQNDWPLPQQPSRLDQTYTWRQVGMLGQDQLPTGQQITDLAPRGANQPDRSFVLGLNLPLTTFVPPVGPLGIVANQYDWPLPRGPSQPDRGFAFGFNPNLPPTPPPPLGPAVYAKPMFAGPGYLNVIPGEKPS